MVQNRAIAAAYAAGVMDSDGTIGVYKYTRATRPNAKNQQYALRISVAQGDGRCIDFLHKNFGGAIRFRMEKSNLKSAYGVCRWYLNGTKAAEFLATIYPCLQYKKDQAKTALVFQEHVNKSPRVRHGHQGLLPTAAGEVAFRERAYRRLARLKKARRKPRALSGTADYRSAPQ